MKKQKDLKTKAERTPRKILKNIKMSLNKKMIKGKKGSRKTSNLTEAGKENRCITNLSGVKKRKLVEYRRNYYLTNKT